MTISWQKTKLIHDNLLDEVKKLKFGDGADFVIFGSGSIVQQLTAAKLIDEYVLVVTPVILGKGKSFFNDVNKLPLTLKSSKDFNSGNVMLHYSLNI